MFQGSTGPVHAKRAKGSACGRTPIKGTPVISRGPAPDAVRGPEADTERPGNLPGLYVRAEQSELGLAGTVNVLISVSI